MRLSEETHGTALKHVTYTKKMIPVGKTLKLMLKTHQKCFFWRQLRTGQKINLSHILGVLPLTGQET